ncbi:MAG: VWA domain-containing protein, partial [Clostridiales bacterium]|nr:VWA domain-containing protein [Clostridiales bacterium]
ESDSISMPGPASESKKKKKEDSGGSSSSGEKPDGSDDLEDDTSGASDDPESSREEGEASSSGKASEAIDGTPSGKPPTDSGTAEEEYTESDAASSIETETIIDAETARRVREEMAADEAEIAEAERLEKEDSASSLDYNVDGGYKKVCSKRNCINTRPVIRLGDEMALADAYTAVVTPMLGGINKVARQLERIFKNSPDEKVHRTSGKIDIDRLCSGTMTARVFTKRRIADKNDMHICIAIDCSGSMRGDSIHQARKAAIALAEVFDKLSIPVSMFGFTADDINNGDPHHIHFITGKNTKRDRLRLLDIKAMSNNFDGYSIRYGAALLKKKSAAHKMLIVISDGAPACSAYVGGNGVMDTKLAIKEASKEAVVFGILVGSASPEVHKMMYGYNFLHIRMPEDLFNGLARCISRQVKEW